MPLIGCTILKFELDNEAWNKGLIRVRCETANLREVKNLPLFKEEIEAKEYARTTAIENIGQGQG